MKYLPLLLLLGCGTGKTSKLPVETSRIKELSLHSTADGQSETKDLMPKCDENCKLWLVAEEKFFCLREGDNWLPLGDYVGPDETMYCRL